jgi:hypothetical protein
LDGEKVAVNDESDGSDVIDGEGLGVAVGEVMLEIGGDRNLDGEAVADTEPDVVVDIPGFASSPLFSTMAVIRSAMSRNCRVSPSFMWNLMTWCVSYIESCAELQQYQ